MDSGATRRLFVQLAPRAPWVDFGWVRSVAYQRLDDPVLLAYCRAIEQAPDRSVQVVAQLERAPAPAPTVRPASPEEAQMYRREAQERFRREMELVRQGLIPYARLD